MPDAVEFSALGDESMWLPRAQPSRSFAKVLSMKEFGPKDAESAPFLRRHWWQHEFFIVVHVVMMQSHSILHHQR